MKCKHLEYAFKHCAEMMCPNYINKCREHRLAADLSDKGKCSHNADNGN